MRVVVSEQAVKKGDLRLDSPVTVRPHPPAIEFGLRGLRRNNGTAAAAFGELPDPYLSRLRVHPKQNRVRRLIHAPLGLVVPEWIWELPRRQAVAKSCLQADQVHSLLRHIFETVLSAEHEERKVHAGDHIWCELREFCVL